MHTKGVQLRFEYSLDYCIPNVWASMIDFDVGIDKNIEKYFIFWDD